MLKRVNSLFVGKDLTRTANINSGGEDMTTVQSNIVEGEVVVLDKDFVHAIPTVTYASSNIIYIAEGSSEIFNTQNPDGSALSGRRLIISSAIDGARLNLYAGKAYSAKAEETATLSAITDSITPGTEYVLRIVYKDIYEDRGQFTDTYRYTAKTADDSEKIFDGLRLRIAKDNGKYSIKRKGGSRVVGSGSTTLILTAKPIPECTSTVNDIDEFTMVNCEVRLNYVDSHFDWTPVTMAAAIAYTAFDRGSGAWEVMRDIEKFAQSYQGVTNRVWFPIVKPEIRVLKGAAYGQIIMEHDAQYRSPDNQYNKETSLTTQIIVDDEAGTNQGLAIQTALNAWALTTPGAFPAITIFS